MEACLMLCVGDGAGIATCAVLAKEKQARAIAGKNIFFMINFFSWLRYGKEIKGK